jgi:hypothetical protein
MKIETRQARVNDIDLLWSLFRASMKQYITQARGEWNEEREESQFRSQLDLAVSRVICSNNLEVGFITVPIRDDALWIHTICIAQEYQNRDIGSEVIRSVIAEAEKRE